MNTALGKPIGDVEALTLDAIDGRDVIGAFAEEARASVSELKQVITDRVVFYHPDPRNVSSVYVVPMNGQDRREVLSKLMSVVKTMPDGSLVKWNNTKPQIPATALPLRCFIANCARAGGFATRVDLISHINGKHPNEVPLYQALIDALMKLVHLDIPAEQYEALGLEAPKGSK